ncbi:MAG: DNA-binding response regulator, partial [Prevotellaceae bacterium]|nr:DNA-binding response regulator [Prevotellaceae bacterium]
MIDGKVTPEALWLRQQIGSLDVDYDAWSKKREAIVEFARLSRSCIFTVDVFKKRYDFASENFSTVFGYNLDQIKTIREQGDLLEERIHPHDRAQMLEYRIEHGQFI